MPGRGEPLASGSPASPELFFRRAGPAGANQSEPALFILSTNLLAFVFALGVIIFVHEAGHLLAAKLFEMRVLAFSLGFGKRLFGFQRGETDYRVSAIPLGGYVRLSGENPDETAEDPADFPNRPRWQRIAVYLAGPLANFALSLVLIAGVFVVGVEVSGLRKVPPVVGAVEPESPAAVAGLAAGDVVARIDGKPVERWQQVAETLLTSPGRPVPLEIERAGSRLELSVTPNKDEKYGIGLAGVYPRVLPRVAEVFPGSPAAAAGLRPGDEVRTLDGRPVEDTQAFIAFIEERAGQPTTIEVLREGQVTALSVVPEDQSGKGKIGVRLGAFQRYGLGEALVESWHYNLDVVRQTLLVLGKIFTLEIEAKSALSGPIEIAAWSGAAARSGLRNLIYLMGVISISIGLLNLFPIPLLDGGQIFMLLVESVIRRDLPLAWKERINQVGFLLIIGLMGTALVFDVMKNWPPAWLAGS
jgi:regulator of sigma E protease